MSEYNEKAEQAHCIIHTCAHLLERFLVDDDSGNEIPSEIKGNYVRGSLLLAIKLAADELLGNASPEVKADDGQ